MKKIALRTIMIGLTFLILIPFLWMFSTSFKPLAEASSYPPKWITPNVTLKPYSDMFSFLPFSTYTLNSLIVAISATLLTLFIGSLASFAFSRFKLTPTLGIVTKIVFPDLNLKAKMFFC